MREHGYEALYQALSISHELVRIAPSGDAAKVQLLNSQRARLIREFLDGAHSVTDEDLITLEQISSLNRTALAHLEASQRGTMMELTTLTKGALAVQAYGATQRRS